MPRILHQFKLREISAVTKPAVDGAKAVMVKADRASGEFAKAAFDVALAEMELSEAVASVCNEMWTLNEALRRSVQEISQHSDRYPDPVRSIKESLQEFVGAVTHMVLGVSDDVQYSSLIGKDGGKSEGGKVFPASDYAYVPDPEKPSTWKLRLTATPGGEPDPRIVGAAVAALGPGFRGNKVQIPAEDRSKVLARVRSAWRKANPDEELPDVLKKSEEEEEMSKTIEQLQKELDDAKAFGALNDAERSHYAKLADREREGFLKMSASMRGDEVRKAAEANPVVYTASDGTQFFKSDDPRAVAQARRGDELEKQLATEKAEREAIMLTKRAEAELPNLPGDATIKVALLKAVSGIQDEKVREGIGALLKAGNDSLADAFVSKGSKATSGEADVLDAMARKYMVEHPGMTFEKAYDAVFQTPEGQRAYAAAK